jgi:uncharacterized protein YkwD
MAKSRVKKGRKPYRGWSDGAPPTGTAAPYPAVTAPPEARIEDRAKIVPQVSPVSDDVARLQRRVIGSDAWLRRIEDHVVQLVNAERRRRHLGTLRIDERLRRSARAHSADMAERGFFGHRAPDGRVPADRIRERGHPQPAAENIARGQADPPTVMRAWMNSPQHRANIMHPQVRSIGVGLHRGSGGPWWTQHFGYE